MSNLEAIPAKQEPPSNVLVIYHGRCTDGWTAAWIARKVFPEAQFHAAHFNEPPPDVTNKEVFILDFHYKRSVLLAMKAKAKSLIVLDHHQSAVSELEGLPGCICDMDRSGAGLAWHYFSHFSYPGYTRDFDEPIPWLVRYVQDEDLWRHELSQTRAVNAVISSFPFDFRLWDELANRSLKDVQHEGEPIYRYQKQIANDLLAYAAREVNFDGHKVLAVNTSIMNSHVGNLLAKDRPFGIVWFQREDGKYIYSLRSTKNGLDVEQVAKAHRGGGHRLSSGFMSDKLLI